jgi:Zn-dependent protease
VTPQQIQQFLPVLIIGVVATLVIIRNMKPRRLRLEMMWVRPLIIMSVAAGFLVLNPFPHQPYALAVIAAAAVVGTIVGFLRGRMVRVTVDPETHTAMSQASPLGVGLILLIIGARYFLSSTAGTRSGHFDAQAMLVTDALLIFGAGVVGVTGLEVWMRANRMVNESKAAKVA